MLHATPQALLALLVLGVTTFLSLEDWPLNATVLFPYNHAQQQAIVASYGHFRLAFADTTKPTVIHTKLKLPTATARVVESTLRPIDYAKCANKSSRPTSTSTGVSGKLNRAAAAATTKLGPCLVQKACNRDPAMFEPVVSRLILAAAAAAAAAGGGGGAAAPRRRGAVYHELRAFIQKHRPYVDRSSYRCYDDLIYCTNEAK